MSSPLLSIGMIVKNEIRCIQRCMESLQPLRDAISCQLVIADTGSSDGTREVVEKYADILLDVTWDGDFAAARNAVLDFCTGKWCLSLDADEWLEDITALTEFLSGAARKNYNNVMCIVRNYTDERLSDYGDFYVDRLAQRRGGKLRYHFPIHEQLYYTDGLDFTTTALPKFILHHDGYTNLSPQHMKEKRHRNIVILREELQKDSDNLRLLIHALQSAEDPEEMQEYIERALRLAPTQTKNAYSSLAYQNSTQFFLKKRENRRVVSLYDQWRGLWPQSSVLEVDGEAAAAVAEYALEHDEAALEHIQRWKKGVCRAEHGEDLDSNDRLFTQYYMNTQAWHGKLACIEVQCLLRLERYDEATQAIQNIDLRPVEKSNRVSLMKLVFQHAENLPYPDTLIKKCWDLCIPSAEESKDGESERLTWKNTFVSIINSWMRQDEEKTLSLISKLHSSPLGLSAQIIKSDCASDIAALWERVDDWEDILPQAYFHTLELSLPFPDGFYHQKAGFLRALVEALAKNIPDFVLRTAHLALLPTETLVKQQFQYDLTVAALQMMAPLREAGEKEACQTLCTRFSELAQEMLPKMYHPNLLQTPEDWGALSGMHQFGLWIWTAQRYKQSGDQVGYLQALRYGLRTAPLMKDMVGFLLEQAEKENKISIARQKASPELVELAEKVRAILAQYSPDDPAVAALKQSEVYKKVAYLIEGADASIFGVLPQ